MDAKTLYQKSENYLRELLKERLPTGSQIFLFGSRAKGETSSTADIDIGILPKKPLDNTILWELQETIEDSFVPYHVDLVDFSKISETFKQHALKKTIPWN
ncbi:nucleotidyltransferase domain-containing protein [Candidatus Parabeggiatoa sp. HSG14]|uniref:nucleotidyltransferase family protein n=1 Tax=Candidatus Parabeggiatoa sp. HSG14 TaxID=3055593 RepID=UPI0025A7F9FF|nr:nucleotidyltransferase domain-containing protein [Thiotrichales bacterium HSG14]